MSDEFELDYVIVGSGFGGSVSALRLAEKGYRVAMLEQGKRWKPEDFAKSTWDLRKYLWKPSLGLHGILQMTLLRDVFFFHGAGVGGGSLVYANTLLVPPPAAFDDPQWVGLDWKKELAPHYDTAKRMLGAVPSEVIAPTDRFLQSVAADLGRGETFHRATVGVYFGKPGERVKDPFFGGEGPDRVGCIQCGACMVGCQHEAKNTLDKNYLYLAEKRGVTVHPEMRVVRIEPLAGGGYEITAKKSIGWLRPTIKLRTKGVVVSAGSFGTVSLLMKCADEGALTKLSPQLGAFVRTNSEALLAVRSKQKNVDFSKGIAISAGAFVDDKTHIEIVRYPKGSDSMSVLTTVLTGGGGAITRRLKWLWNMIRRPLEVLRIAIPFGWAQRTAILLVMQPIDSSLRYVRRRRWYWPFSRVTDTTHGDKRIPVHIPIANDVAQRLAKKMDGIAQSGLIEVALNRSSTAHILGGCPIGLTAETGVVDPYGRLFGYENFLVVDGSIVPANLGVNPSLTITALAEHVMANVPDKPGTNVPKVRLPVLPKSAHTDVMSDDGAHPPSQAKP